jgi:hypothetical protein
MALRKLIGRFVTNWPICSRNFAPVGGESCHTVTSGEMPAAISPLEMKGDATICRSQLKSGDAASYINARIVSKIFRGFDALSARLLVGPVAESTAAANSIHAFV